MFKSTHVILAVALCVAASPTAIFARGFGGGGGYRGGGGEAHENFGGSAYHTGGFGGSTYHPNYGGGAVHEGGYGGGSYHPNYGGSAYHEGGYGGYSSVGSYNEHLLETTPVGGASSWGNSTWGHSTWGGGIETNDMDAVARGGAVTTQHTGPAGYTVDRGVAGVQGAAVGPYGAAGGARVGSATVVKNPEGQVVYANANVAGRGAAVGANGAVYGRSAAGGSYYGTRPYSATAYHAQAVGVNRWYGTTGIYGNAWVGAHPFAWRPYGYAAAAWAGAIWANNNWNNYNDWLYNNDGNNSSSSSAIPYDYGDNITYNNGDVYYGTQPVGTQAQYYQQAATLADATPPPQPADNSTPAPGAAPTWLPMGVFGLVGPEEKTPASIYQLAINKQGIIQGNCTITSTSQVAAVQGSADLKTQRCAWMVVGDKSFVVETGLYNLTQDEAPALVHFGPDHSEQCLLVRLKNPDASGQSSATGQASAAQSQ